MGGDETIPLGPCRGMNIQNDPAIAAFWVIGVN